jgi:hypothetical protein
MGYSTHEMNMLASFSPSLLLLFGGFCMLGHCGEYGFDGVVIFVGLL